MSDTQLVQVNTNDEIQKYLKKYRDTGYDDDYEKAYYQDELIKKFSTLAKTKSANDKLTKAELYTKSADYDKLTKAVTSSVTENCKPQINGMSPKLLATLIVLLQSVILFKVPVKVKGSSEYGVELYFSDNLQTSDNLIISDFLKTTEPNDEAVVAHVSMMQTILYELYRTYKLIAFYYIYRNNEVVLSKDERYSSSFRHSIASPETTETPKTTETPETPKTPGSLFYTEVNRIVNRIFIVSRLNFETKILPDTIGQVRIQMLPYMGDIDTENKILPSLLDFLKEVEDSDIMLDTPTTITLTLHDKIKLTQRVKDHPTYCTELSQFINVMRVVCNVCTITIRKKNAKMSVKYTIPQGIMNSLHRSVKSCGIPLDAAAAPLDDADAATGGDGRTPRRKHARKTNRKHNRKTRHKRARKTRRGHSHSRKLKRHLRIRKHKKYTSRRK